MLLIRVILLINKNKMMLKKINKNSNFQNNLSYHNQNFNNKLNKKICNNKLNNNNNKLKNQMINKKRTNNNNLTKKISNNRNN